MEKYMYVVKQSIKKSNRESEIKKTYDEKIKQK